MDVSVTLLLEIKEKKGPPSGGGSSLLPQWTQQSSIGIW